VTTAESQDATTSTDSAGLVEVRFYTARPGRRDELAAFLDRVVLPFNTSRGVQVVASLVDIEHEDTYVWIRRFADEADRARAYEAIYQDPTWMAEVAPVIGELMFRERSVITRAVPTPNSPLQ
jgi:hypothetical protein